MGSLPQELEHVNPIQPAAEEEIIDPLNALSPRPGLLKGAAQRPGQPQQSLDMSAVACTPHHNIVTCLVGTTLHVMVCMAWVSLPIPHSFSSRQATVYPQCSQ